MDRLSALQDMIAQLLLTVDGTVKPSGYKYYTTTGSVNIEDEVLANAKNSSTTAVNYCVELDGSENATSYTYGQNAYANRVVFLITAKCKNVNTSTHPKKDITYRMNEVLSDLKFLFNENYSLGRIAELAIYIGSTRVIHPSENRITSGDLQFRLQVDYAQMANNPDMLGC